MTASRFKAGLVATLEAAGCRRAGRLVIVEARDVDVPKVVGLVDFQSLFGSRWAINVGFQIGDLDPVIPDRVERSHMYFRLENMFPEHEETIVQAGAMGEAGQADAYERLRMLFSASLVQEIRSRLSIESLRMGFDSGKYSAGIITPAAREYLKNSR